MSGPRLVHVGSAVMDYVYRLDRLPQPGEDKTAQAYAQLVGGGFNMMAAAVRTGFAVAFGGQHGTGPNGDALRAALAREGVALLLPPAQDMDTGNCTVIVTADAERTFVSWPGAEGVLLHATLAALVLRPRDWVFTSGYTLSYPTSREALCDWITALPADIPFVFDPAPVVADIPNDILTRVLARTTWLSCNDREAAFITGSRGSLDTMAEQLFERCPDARGIVVRAGEEGCFVRLRDKSSRGIGGFPVEAIDTNGAGDTHIGAFVSALARGFNPFEAARYANAAAAISVTRHGGSTAPADDEIQAFLSAARAPKSGCVQA